MAMGERGDRGAVAWWPRHIATLESFISVLWPCRNLCYNTYLIFLKRYEQLKLGILTANTGLGWGVGPGENREAYVNCFLESM
jgi:hypothetical protein